LKDIRNCTGLHDVVKLIEEKRSEFVDRKTTFQTSTDRLSISPTNLHADVSVQYR